MAVRRTWVGLFDAPEFESCPPVVHRPGLYGRPGVLVSAEGSVATERALMALQHPRQGDTSRPSRSIRFGDVSLAARRQDLVDRRGTHSRSSTCFN
jgi:hypothetical protein